ncbi:MAG: hypothetical protein KF795_17865 [Labilithrix sp.]|nr:hypothetical protein [Labilithrix sp.]
MLVSRASSLSDGGFARCGATSTCRLQVDARRTRVSGGETCMRSPAAVAAVAAYAASVRAGALGGELPNVPEQRERLIYERRRVGRIEADEERAALGELLDAVERVVDCIETGDHRALAVRALDASTRRLDYLPR